MIRHRLLLDERAIAARVQELAHAIRRDLPTDEVVVVGVLTGSFVFVADLVRAAARLGVEALTDFLALSLYRQATVPSNRVEILKDITLEVRARSVLLVDDIVDTGITLQHARTHLAARQPAWLRTCVLLNKAARRVVPITADYVGFEVPDCWLVGYGLDLAGQGRALPYVAALEPEAHETTPRDGGQP